MSTQFGWFFAAAMSVGVRPFESLAKGFAPSITNNGMTSSLPHSAAKWRAV
eukprot:CAMPEP_0177277256 /NCGR_PEP_ID=MMETSP0367-20130122/68696_1 /TAXON_ID=447022 ORGANISM="Scrippsiella hangoei-like, Strain SHHI-4" /NCGR_SAMPLE_ID=MMETSP0367 /ASSEMBLY_ACC=CAM_ASM_000362 /LENGTH=50 /DNA_ID=CAMNT_0018733831 /DNA_START=51 /DNA_END=203 /DNA_ORIENTATION=-